MLDIKPLKLSTEKLLLFILINIPTFFIIFLLTRWHTKLRLKLLYTDSTVDEATHFLVTSWDGNQEIKKKIVTSDNIT